MSPNHIKSYGLVTTSMSPSPGWKLCFLFCGSGPENGHEAALELVSGGNIGCALHHFSSPTRWDGSRGEARSGNGPKPPKTKMHMIIFITNSKRYEAIEQLEAHFSMHVARPARPTRVPDPAGQPGGCPAGLSATGVPLPLLGRP